MAVPVLSRWSGGDREKFIAFAKKAKPIFEKLGAEVRVGQIFIGPHAGQWVATARYADWESFGKSTQVLTSDPTDQKMLAEMMATFKLDDRSIIAGIDFVISARDTCVSLEPENRPENWESYRPPDMLCEHDLLDVCDPMHIE
jgi:hypothetical protein